MRFVLELYSPKKIWKNKNFRIINRLSNLFDNSSYSVISMDSGFNWIKAKLKFSYFVFISIFIFIWNFFYIKFSFILCRFSSYWTVFTKDFLYFIKVIFNIIHIIQRRYMDFEVDKNIFLNSKPFFYLLHL